MKSIVVALSALVASFAALTANAGVISESDPYAGGAFGQQSDANTPAYVQAVPGAALATYEAVSWWGYHGLDSAGSGSDEFSVLLNDSFLSGTLTASPIDAVVWRYTLAISPWTGVASTLSVVNLGVDVEWYWQSAASFGGAHADEVAYRIEGNAAAVPEPATTTLLFLGLLCLSAFRRINPKSLGLRASAPSPAKQ